jgi:hypothetical protein
MSLACSFACFRTRVYCGVHKKAEAITIGGSLSMVFAVLIPDAIKMRLPQRSASARKTDQMLKFFIYIDNFLIN